MNTRGTQIIRHSSGIMTLPTSVEFWSYYTFLSSLSKSMFSINVCVCTYTYIPHLYKYTYIYYQSGTKVVVVWDCEF